MGRVRVFGVLHVRIRDATSISIHPNVDYEKYTNKCTRCTAKTCNVVTCNQCRCGYADCCCGKADPFVILDLVQGKKVTRLGLTETVSNSHTPQFNYDYPHLVDITMNSKKDALLRLRLMDDDFSSEVGADQLGIGHIPLRTLLELKGRMDLTPVRIYASENDQRVVTQLNVGLRFFSMQPLDDSLEVPHTYFKAHLNCCKVVLYHDADIHPSEQPFVHPLDKGAFFRQSACWEDLYKSINDARHFIFIVGWSVDTKISLRRDWSGRKEEETVGDLLLRKANDGVSVCLMLWDDFTSRSMFNSGTAASTLKSGLMGTHDEETFNFFKDTRVQCRLVPRKSTQPGFLQNILNSAVFTHHQKVVCLDCQEPSDPQRQHVMAYFGGLDITTGRYDTREHTLFRSLVNAHKQDFYNGCLPGVTKQCGPREPWHDIHGRVVGPAAWDLLTNFLERMKRQAPDLDVHSEQLIASLQRSGLLASLEESHLHDGTWSVQIFRSLDGASAEFLNAHYTKRFKRDIQVVDKSIQQAYLYHVNRAKLFIYIENQYFLGSAMSWLDPELRDTPSMHLIPEAIVSKIERKIQYHEPFVAYILLPLFPEGVPSTSAIQEILHFQYQTVSMMYKRVAKAIAKAGLEAHPLDYLMFFFAGQREIPHSRIAQRPLATDAAQELQNTQTSRRHQIYVHSKMMLVDDEYVLFGSANINQRSMDGQRDTEIVGGCWEDAHRCRVDAMGNLELPRGQVHGFRCSLWSEHLGGDFQVTRDPCSIDAVRFVRDVARRNLKVYLGREVESLPSGHLCMYPYEVSQDGSVVNHVDCETIPDHKALLCGQPSKMMIDLLTT